MGSYRHSFAMSRFAIVLIALVIVGMAVASGQGSTLLSSVERGLGWGIGREVAHSLFARVAR